MIRSIALSSACHDFIRYSTAEGKSARTIADFKTAFRKALPLPGSGALLGDAAGSGSTALPAALPESADVRAGGSVASCEVAAGVPGPTEAYIGG